MSHSPKHILVVCCLVRDHRDRILLVRHKKRGWELPQGRVEEGEDLISALHREVLEESGITLTRARLAIVWSKISDPSAVICGFTAHSSGGAPAVSEETPEVDWCLTDEARQRISHPVNRDRFAALLTHHDGPPRFRSYATGPYRILS